MLNKIVVYLKLLKINMFNKKHAYTFLLALTMIGLLSKAQKGYKFEYGVISGISNYLGEIGGRDKAKPFILDLKLAKTRWNEGAYIRYRFHPSLAARVSAHYLRISGEDRLSTNLGRKYRNLSFRNDIYDIEAVMDWIFFSSSKPTGIYKKASSTYLTCYLFAGIGGFYHNPKTTYQGSVYSLQTVKTEGVSYSRFGYCIPFGAGFYIAISKRRFKSHRIGMEINWRYTNTDYLDDVSTTWKSPAELSNTAFQLANRNDELTSQPDGMAGNYGWIDDGNGGNKNLAPRGNPNNKDSYISLNISYGIAIKSRYTKSRGRKIRSVTF